MLLSPIYSSLSFAAPTINLLYIRLTPTDPHVLLDIRRFEWWLRFKLPPARREKTTFLNPAFPLRLPVTRGWLGPSQA